MNRETAPPRRLWIAPLAAITGLLSALGCCLPIGFFLAAAGFAGAGALLVSARPLLAGLSIVLLVLGFVQSYGVRQCRRRTSLPAVVVLWAATALVLMLFLFPYAISGLLADLLPSGATP